MHSGKLPATKQGGLPISDALKAAIPKLPGGKLIDEPGVYVLPYNVYHLDPCVMPSLSSTAVRTALNESMWHLWTNHPRLNPGFQPTHKKQFDLGHCSHQLVLMDGARLEVIDAPDYVKRKVFDPGPVRDAAYLRGDTPLLRHQYDNAAKMAQAAMRQIERSEHHSHAFQIGQGLAEVAAFWQAPNGVWCRALLDWLVLAEPFINSSRTSALTYKIDLPQSGKWDLYDYKWTGTNANPIYYGQHASAMGYHIQDAFHSMCLSGATGVHFENINFWLCAQECDLPHALSFMKFKDQARQEALDEVTRVIELFGQCMMAGSFPGYHLGGAEIDLSPTARYRAQDRWESDAWDPKMLQASMDAFAPLMIE
ncbi:MAG: PD-(D/E)XK nuclease-like domain-containing protein [Geminicoccaceae bacterium]